MSEKTHDGQAQYKEQEHFSPVCMRLFYLVIPHLVHTPPEHSVAEQLLHHSSSRVQAVQLEQEEEKADRHG